MIEKLNKTVLSALASMTVVAAVAQVPEGAWRGDLVVGSASLPLVFNFAKAEDGKTTCTMDSPAQGARGLYIDVMHCSADSVALICRQIQATYSGHVSSGRIDGTFGQAGRFFPLVLTPEAAIEERRPQTPKAPYPYFVKDTTFTAPDGAVMAATLTLPATPSSARVPAVVMVTGSGPQNRDEELFEHKPFAVIADMLARNGIASLRYDDRGTGKSTGDFSKAVTATFRDDAAAGVDFLRGIPMIGKVGVLGHSEGGTIAFMLGAQGKVDFAVSLAGMAVSGKETMLRQNAAALERSGITGTSADNNLKLISLVFDKIAEQNKQSKAEQLIVSDIARDLGVATDPGVVLSLQTMQRQRTPWLDAFIGLDGRDYLPDVKCPLLAIGGDKDCQVAPDNLDVVRSLVPQARVLLMPGLNHLLQHAVTGRADEYATIRETISPDVLTAIADFIKGL